jgi:hypothetical protein
MRFCVTPTSSRSDDGSFAVRVAAALRNAGLSVATSNGEACDYDISAGLQGPPKRHQWLFLLQPPYGSDDTFDPTLTYRTNTWVDRYGAMAQSSKAADSPPFDAVKQCDIGGAALEPDDLPADYDDRVAAHFVNQLLACDALTAFQTWLASKHLSAVNIGTPVPATNNNDTAVAAAASSTTSPLASTPPPSSTPVATFVAAAPQPANYALIVGIERYRDVPAATGGRADAEQFAQLAKQTLGLKDDHVRLATEDHATRTDVLEGLKWLRDNVTAGGRVYFYFSGHGAPSPDTSTYLLPYDGDPRDVAGTAIAMSDVMSQLGQTHAHDVLAIVDSCFSGAGGRSVLPPGARPLIRVMEAQPAPQMALFTASQGDEISGLAPGESGGVFTKYVTMGLGNGDADTNGDGQIVLQELSDWVSPRVARDSKTDKREQHPKLVVGSTVGDASSFVVEYGLATK